MPVSVRPDLRRPDLRSPHLRRPGLRRLVACLPLLGTALALGACSVTKDPPAFCPRMGLLENAGDIARFQGSGRDITDQTLTGSIGKVPATCTAGSSDKTVVTDLSIQSVFTRGAAAKGRTDQVTYLVTVLDGDKIIDQQDFPLVISFPEHVDRAAFTTAPIHLVFPVPEKVKPNYRVFVSFRLTQAELEYNRTHPSR